MLPGFRFLFAAIVLSLSILVFGLGAAALLRAAHEQFASLPSRRAPAEPVFTKRNDAPTLALLRFDPPALDKPSENVPAVAAPDAVTPAAQTPEVAPAEPEKLAALPEEPMLAEAAKPAAPATETTAAPAATIESEAPPAVAVAEEVKVAAVAETPAPSFATAPVATQPATDTLLQGGSIAATRIATLGGPAVIVNDEKTAANATDAKPDRSAIRKRAAQRARERRRSAARRARLAAQQAALAAQQQQANPFGQTAVARAAQ